MNSRPLFIVVMGLIALTALVTIAIESHWGTDAAINGTIAIAGAAVGALAALAGRGNDKSDEYPEGYIELPPTTPPSHGWPDQKTKENQIG